MLVPIRLGKSHFEEFSQFSSVFFPLRCLICPFSRSCHSGTWEFGSACTFGALQGPPPQNPTFATKQSSAQRARRAQKITGKVHKTHLEAPERSKTPKQTTKITKTPKKQFKCGQNHQKLIFFSSATFPRRSATFPRRFRDTPRHSATFPRHSGFPLKIRQHG